jgi:hypothetical protein
MSIRLPGIMLPIMALQGPSIGCELTATICDTSFPVALSDPSGSICFVVTYKQRIAMLPSRLHEGHESALHRQLKGLTFAAAWLDVPCESAATCRTVTQIAERHAEARVLIHRRRADVVTQVHNKDMLTL